MQNLSSAKYKMILSTSQRLTTNTALVSALPTYSNISTLFLADFTQLQSVCEQLAVNKTGVSITKRTLRKDMAEKAMEVELKMIAYAKVTANDTLLQECDVTKTELLYGKEVEGRNKAMLIHTKATTNLFTLSAYGVTATLLTALKTAIDNFTTAIPSSKFSQADKKDLTTKRDKLIKNCEGYLEKIDALVELIRVTQPTFYAQYKEARKVTRSGGTVRVRGVFKDSDSGNTLRGVSLSIESEDTSQKIELKTNSKRGGFRVKTLSEGNYTLTASKPGYTKSTTTFSVCSTERCDLELQLKKTA